MRIVNLSAGGDPFLSLFVLKLFKERFYDEVDRFYINYNNHSGVPQDVVGEFLSRASQDKKVHIIYHPVGIGNGVPITQGTLLAEKESLIMLLEDDGFIFEPGIVDECFKKIESNETDLLGSPRYAYGEVADAAQKKYNLDYSGLGDNGFGWWPNFFFCKREDLIKTDLDFGSKEYLRDVYYKELDHTFSEKCYTDTFTWASIQLRNLGLRSLDIPQNHADPYEIESKHSGAMNWREPMKWVHGGSLSSGWGGYLNGPLPDTSNESAKKEMETRIAFWTICSDIVEGFDDFKVLYRAGIYNLTNGKSLDEGDIQKKINIYKKLMRV